MQHERDMQQRDHHSDIVKLAMQVQSQREIAKMKPKGKAD
jgi:hypothetical protein